MNRIFTIDRKLRCVYSVGKTGKTPTNDLTAGEWTCERENLGRWSFPSFPDISQFTVLATSKTRFSLTSNFPWIECRCQEVYPMDVAKRAGGHIRESRQISSHVKFCLVRFVEIFSDPTPKASRELLDIPKPINLVCF